MPAYDHFTSSPMADKPLEGVREPDTLDAHLRMTPEQVAAAWAAKMPRQVLQPAQQVDQVVASTPTSISAGPGFFEVVHPPETSAMHAANNPPATPEAYPEPIVVLAQTMWGEARGNGNEGMIAVGHVMMNRASNPSWWGHDIVSVCQKPFQFSCWNADDPNLPKMHAVAASPDDEFKAALLIAEALIAGTMSDPTNNADSYYDTSIAPPQWTAGHEPVYILQDLRFYRLQLGPKG